MTERGGRDSGLPAEPADTLRLAYTSAYVEAGGDLSDPVSADQPDAIAAGVTFLQGIRPDASPDTLAALVGLVHAINPIGPTSTEQE